MFAGEGFVLQKLTGPGMTFAELDGDAVEYHLLPNQVMRVEPGHVAMFESTVAFDIEMIKQPSIRFLSDAFYHRNLSRSVSQPIQPIHDLIDQRIRPCKLILDRQQNAQALVALGL